MNDLEVVSLTPENISDYGVCGYKDVNKHGELRKKIRWFEEYYPKGLRIKAVMAKGGGYQGMVEYIPGEYAHRPVEARGYMFIHCIFVGFRKEYKGRGLGSLLIGECLEEAERSGLAGVAVVTRKGSFMAGREIFLKYGFQTVDSAGPDFELLALKSDPAQKDPGFKKGLGSDLEKYGPGLTVFRSPQCPYTEKNVQAILDTAQAEYGLKTTLIDLPDARAVQDSPCAFGVFCLIHQGEIISHHPISNTRFRNIMKKRLG